MLYPRGSRFFIVSFMISSLIDNKEDRGDRKDSKVHAVTMKEI